MSTKEGKERKKKACEEKEIIKKKRVEKDDTRCLDGLKTERQPMQKLEESR